MPKHVIESDLTKAAVGLGNVDNTAIEVIYNVNEISGPIGDKITVPTHVSPAGGQTTHPSVLFFPDSWNGWRYWMAHTPYPGGNDDHEDPNLAVSNNGISWQAAPGVTQPLDDADGTPEYNSDVDLKMGPNDTMYLFWRNYDTGAAGAEEKLYYRTSKDGVTWTAKTLAWSNNHTVRRPLSPSFFYEDGGWTIWYVDVVPSPNVVMRARSTTPTPTAWATPTTVNGITVPSGQEPWHIFMTRLGGRYFGLLNDCTLDQSGANGNLLFMQSYDGKTFEVSADTVIPKVNPDATYPHDFLYRATMVPAYEDGEFGFRVWYPGWVSSPSIIWNLYRTFIKIPLAAAGPGTETRHAVLSPSGFTNKGAIFAEDVGDYMKYNLELQLYKNSTGTVALSTTFASLGVVIPTALRATTATGNVRYWAVWLSGATNIPANLFINFFSGEALLRLNTGTFTMVNNTFTDLSATIYIPKTELP